MSVHKVRRQSVQAEGDHSEKNRDGKGFGKSKKPSAWNSVGDKVGRA